MLSPDDLTLQTPPPLRYPLGLGFADLDPAQPAHAAAIRGALEWLDNILKADDRGSGKNDPATAVPVDWLVHHAGIAGLEALVRAAPREKSGEVHPDPVGSIDAVIEASEILLLPWSDDDRHGAQRTAVRALRAGTAVLGLRVYQPDIDPVWLVLDDTATRTIAKKLPTKRPQVSAGFVRVSAFNRECAPPPDALAARVSEWQADFRSAAEAADLPNSVKDALTEQVVPLAARADLVADRYQKRFRGLMFAAHFLAVLGVAALAFEVLMFHGLAWVVGLIGFEVLCFVAVGVIYAWTRRRHTHDRWLYARYLAEQFRQALFLLPAGVNPAAIGANNARPSSDLPRGDHRLSAVVHDALRPTTRVLSDIKDPDSASYVSPQVARRLARGGLLTPQVGYHQRIAKKDHHRAHRLEQWTFGLFLAGTVLAAVHLVQGGMYYASQTPTPTTQTSGPASDTASAEAEPVAAKPEKKIVAKPTSPKKFSTWVIFGAVLIPVIAAAIHAYARYFDYERIAHRSGLIASGLLAVLDRLDQLDRRDPRGELGWCTSDDPTVELLEQAETILASEMNDWLVDASFRPPELAV